MPGINPGIIRKGKQSFTDTPQQCLMIATGQIRTANAFVKQYVAADDELLFPAIKAKAARRMTGRQDRLQFVIAKGDNITVIDKMQRTAVICEVQPPHLAGCRGKGKHLFFEGMEVQFQAVAAMHPVVSEHMVQMAVGIDKPDRLETLIADELLQLFLLGGKIATRIDDEGLFPVVPEYISVLLYGTEREACNAYHNYIFTIRITPKYLILET